MRRKAPVQNTGPVRNTGDAQKGIVTCDECKQPIKIEPVTEALPDGGQKHYFDCPHCGMRFVFAEVTPAGVALHGQIQEKRRALYRQGNTAVDRARIQDEITALQKQLECEVSRYMEHAPATG
ncbi:MAG: hypothetical protein JXA14_22845 [Anaerolineae bacterium]|nr:hypothetical protein [Anaerolineae bacterium]